MSKRKESRIDRPTDSSITEWSFKEMDIHTSCFCQFRTRIPTTEKTGIAGCSASDSTILWARGVYKSGCSWRCTLTTLVKFGLVTEELDIMYVIDMISMWDVCISDIFINEYTDTGIFFEPWDRTCAQSQLLIPIAWKSKAVRMSMMIHDVKN